MIGRIKAALAGVAVVAAAGTAIWMGAATTMASTQGLNYEVDDGVSFTLANGPSALAQPVQAGYADAGVVADIGLASSFDGIAFTGSTNLQDNIWIDDGSQATTPGTYGFPANFTYGFDNHNGTFYMATGPYAGQNLTYAQIRQDFPGHEAFAWVGVVYTGTPLSGYVSSINGVNSSHRNLSIQPNSAGVLVTAVR